MCEVILYEYVCLHVCLFCFGIIFIGYLGIFKQGDALKVLPNRITVWLLESGHVWFDQSNVN